jgi:hypothetical protein
MQEKPQKRKQNYMKTKISDSTENLLLGYDLTGAERGKYHKQMKDGYSITILSGDGDDPKAEKINFIRIDEDILKFFKTTEAINNALRVVMIQKDLLNPD